MVKDFDSKRVNYSSRTVIGADPTLKLNQLGVPLEICKILTKPHIVNNFNIEKLTKIVNEGKANHLTRIYRKKDEQGKEFGPELKSKTHLSKAMFRKGTELYPGDVIVKKHIELKLDPLGQVELPSNWLNNPDFTEVITGNETFDEGDKIIRNKKIINAVLPKKKEIQLKFGDIVDVQLQQGDILSLNRQPFEKL